MEYRIEYASDRDRKWQLWSREDTLQDAMMSFQSLREQFPMASRRRLSAVELKILIEEHPEEHRQGEFG
jgi:hypothetical protein